MGDNIPNRKYIEAFNTAILEKEKQYFGALFLITEHIDLETAILVEKFNGAEQLFSNSGGVLKPTKDVLKTFYKVKLDKSLIDYYNKQCDFLKKLSYFFTLEIIKQTKDKIAIQILECTNSSYIKLKFIYSDGYSKICTIAYDHLFDSFYYNDVGFRTSECLTNEVLYDVLSYTPKF